MGALPSEIAEHIVVANYLRALGWVTWFHPANGGYRFLATGKLLKRLGTSPGVPDIMIFTRGPKTGRPMAIEMKSQSKTARVAPEQREWLIRLAAEGWDAYVCRGATDALTRLRAAGYEGLSQTLPTTPGGGGRGLIDLAKRGGRGKRSAGARSADSLGLEGPGCSPAHPIATPAPRQVLGGPEAVPAP